MYYDTRGSTENNNTNTNKIIFKTRRERDNNLIWLKIKTGERIVIAILFSE